MANVDITITVDETVRDDAVTWLQANTDFTESTAAVDWLTHQIKKLVLSCRHCDAVETYNTNVEALIDMTGLE